MCKGVESGRGSQGARGCSRWCRGNRGIREKGGLPRQGVPDHALWCSLALDRTLLIVFHGSAQFAGHHQTTQTDVACVEDLEGMDEEPKKAPRPHNEQELVVAEDREEGAVAVGIWKLYIQQLGFGWVSVFTLLLVLSQVAQVKPL